MTAAAVPARAASELYPETPLDRCVQALGPGFLDDPDGTWAAALTDKEVQEVLGAYGRYRRCLSFGAADPDSLPAPAPLAAAAADTGPWPLFDFYRSCLREREGGPSARAACKRLLKVYANGFLDERADWDALCSDWCRSYLSGDAGVCRRAVERFSAPGLSVKEPLVAQCLEYSGLSAEACPAAGPGAAALRRAECVERAAVASVLRSRDAAACPEEARASCEAALAADPGHCSRLHSLPIAFVFCR